MLCTIEFNIQKSAESFSFHVAPVASFDQRDLTEHSFYLCSAEWQSVCNGVELVHHRIHIL